jgi:3-(3-hydroxy-phenyl)propionate hydroxylase
VIAGHADADLIDTYHDERSHGSAENILNSSRATNFMTPKTPIEALFRAEALRLAHDQPFARRILNSGRLSMPCSLEGFALQTPGAAQVPPGSPLIDAPLAGDAGETWLLREVQGDFTLVGFGDVALPDVPGVRRIGVCQRAADYPCFTATHGHAIRRYGSDIAYLFRPDGHVAAAFRRPSADDVARAVARAMGKTPEAA